MTAANKKEGLGVIQETTQKHGRRGSGEGVEIKGSTINRKGKTHLRRGGGDSY